MSCAAVHGMCGSDEKASRTLEPGQQGSFKLRGSDCYAAAADGRTKLQQQQMYLHNLVLFVLWLWQVSHQSLWCGLYRLVCVVLWRR